MHGKRETLNEGLRMSKFSHARVMPLIGISFDDHFSPLIITPYMCNGSLDEYLRKNAESVRLTKQI
jgi:hypothetical protein